jgi:hypothetical protein
MSYTKFNASKLLSTILEPECLGQLSECTALGQDVGVDSKAGGCRMTENKRRSFQFLEVQELDKVYFLHIWKGVLFFSFLNFKGKISFFKNVVAKKKQTNKKKLIGEVDCLNLKVIGI